MTAKKSRQASTSTIPQLTMTTSRIRPVTVNDEDDESVESQQSRHSHTAGRSTIRTMESFAHELDDLTRSLEQGPDLQEMVHRARTATQSAAARSSPYGAVQNSNNRYADYRTTPERGTRPSSMRPQSRTTPTGGEPLPVRTPPYQPSQQQQQRSPVPPPADPYVRFDDENCDRYKSRPPPVVAHDRGKDVSAASLQLILDSMRDTLDRQESHIRSLEQENEALRVAFDRSARPVTERPLVYEKSPRRRREPWEQSQPLSAPAPVRSPPPPAPLYDYVPPSSSSRREQQQQPYASTPLSRSPAPVNTYSRGQSREYTPPAALYRRGVAQEEEEDARRGRPFSPGTKFVAELSNVMDLDVGYHAPLSVIMDKHWDRVNQIRTRHGWDR